MTDWFDRTEKKGHDHHMWTGQEEAWKYYLQIITNFTQSNAMYKSILTNTNSHTHIQIHTHTSLRVRTSNR